MKNALCFPLYLRFIFVRKFQVKTQLLEHSNSIAHEENQFQPNQKMMKCKAASHRQFLLNSFLLLALFVSLHQVHRN